MKFTKPAINCSSLRFWAATLLSLTVGTAVAAPYASCLTNNAGSVSFRLNEDAPMVAVIGNSGTLSNYLGAVARGLTQTNLTAAGMTGGVFQVYVAKTGNGLIQTNSPPIAFNSPRGVAVNKNPASAFFGRVYVANSTNGIKGDGIFVFDADLNETFAQGATPRTAGLDFITGDTTAKPYRLSVGEEDSRLYICDWSDPTGNLYLTDPDVTTNGFALQPLTGTAVRPVTSANNHGSIAAVAVVGLERVNLTIYTVDEDLSTDRDISMSEMNSLWQYPVGTGSLPTSLFDPTNKLATPAIATVSQTMDLARGPNGYLYMSQYRSAGSQPAVYVVDPIAGVLTNTLQISQALGETTDILKATGGVAVSPDGRLLAVVNIEDNSVTVVRLEGGIPDLSRRARFTGLGSGAGRGIAFDAANNLLVVADGGANRLQGVSLGLTSVAVTGSDGTYSLTVPPVVYVLATNAPAAEAGQTPSSFTLIREGDTTGPLTVNFALSGTASNTIDYVATPSGSAVTFAAGESVKMVTITPIDDSLSEPNESVTLTLNSSADYSLLYASSATLAIVDNDPPLVTISALQSSMYEPLISDSVTFQVVRGGDPNASDLTVYLSYSGTATSNVDYTAVEAVYLPYGQGTNTFTLSPIDDSIFEGNETIVVTVAPNPAYVLGTPSSATVTLVDNEDPPAITLFADDFENDTSANWTVKWGAANNVSDYTNRFSVDYGTMGIYSPPGTTTSKGLLVSVNKNDATASAAGVNLYPNGQSFSGDYALRFQMYIEGVNGAGTTEHVIFGMNHSGTMANWATRSSSTGITGRAGGDGLWVNIVEDASGFPGGNDYGLFYYPTPTSNPTLLASRTAASLANVFKAGSYRYDGSPCGYSPSAITNWADVELKQVSGVVTLSVNHTPIFSYTNTTGVNSGNIMLGYNDAFGSIGGGTANSDLHLGGFVIYDNVRVLSLAQLMINRIQKVGDNIEVTFTDATYGPFTLLSASSVTGTYSSVSATITTNSPGSYKAVTPFNSGEAARFYRIQR